VANAEKRYRISLLLDAYGELLTDKQQDFLRRYYEEDFSFGEIAREYKVSRQAIFDSVKHGEAALENYERVLGLVEAREDGRASTRPVRLTRSASRAGESAERLRRWLASSGGDRPTVRAIAELESLAEELEALAVDLKQAAGESTEIRDPEGGAMAGAGGGRQGGSGAHGSLLVGDGPEVD
jgi:hypothetical protein